MERVGNSWTLAALAALVILSSPVKSWCKEQTHKSPWQNKPESLPGDFADLKRFNDLDYDSFIGLMGRRIADWRNTYTTRKRDMDDVFVGLLGRKRSKPSMALDMANPWKEREYSQARGDLPINRGRLMFQRLV